MIASEVVKMAGKLSAKQQAWIDYYKQGRTATEAARLAGYKGRNHHVIGAQNLIKLKDHIQDRDTVLESPRVADMEEINAYWTSVMRNAEETTKNRLKASELRMRAAGGFVDNVQLHGKMTVDQSKLDGIIKQLWGENKSG